MSAEESELKPLMLHALGGDVRAQGRLFEGCAARLRRYHFQRLPWMDADDLVQETLIALHLHRARYDVDRSFTKWIDAIAHHKLLDHLRGLYRRATVPLACGGEEWPATSPDPDARLDVERLLGGLSPGQSESVRMVKVHGWSTAETAHRTGNSVSNVKIRVHRGMKTMRRQVEENAKHGWS